MRGLLLYIGDTGRSLGSRFSEHLLKYMEQINTPGSPVAQHFNPISMFIHIGFLLVCDLVQ